MSSVSNILLDKEILLESGTNEVELLVFDVGCHTFGINVAKVREVLPVSQITTLPQAHSSIRGVFKLRNDVVPCVSLQDHLGIGAEGENSESTMILSDFNQQQTAFLVNEVERIHRISCEDILPVPGLDTLAHAPITALARCENRLILMLDFEQILDEVTDQYFRTDAVDNPLGLAREEMRILLAEDSATVREAIGNKLYQSGYQQVIFPKNGAQAWQWCLDQLQQHQSVGAFCDLVICHVEMPQTDGLHLTRCIKEHPKLRQLPVLLYSSIITPDNYKKGQAVGADAQVSKPELAKVVHLADELIYSARQGRRAAAIEQAAREAQAADGAAAAASPAPGLPASPAPASDTLAVGSSQSTTSQPAEQPSAGRSSEPGPGPAPQSDDLSCRETDSGRPDARLRRTFLRELEGRVRDLRELLDRTRGGQRREEVHRQTARILHTIKSAAMVVPVDEIAHCTHAAEGLLVAARQDASRWPQEALEQYTDWLAQVVQAPEEIGERLAAAEQLAEQWRSCTASG